MGPFLAVLEAKLRDLRPTWKHLGANLGRFVANLAFLIASSRLNWEPLRSLVIASSRLNWELDEINDTERCRQVAVY